jgi:hypothetical protein
LLGAVSIEVVPDGVGPGFVVDGVGVGVVGAGLAAPDPGTGATVLPDPTVWATADPIAITVTPPPSIRYANHPGFMRASWWE